MTSMTNPYLALSACQALFSVLYAINSSNPHNNPTWGVLLLSPAEKSGRSKERFRDWSQATELLRAKSGSLASDLSSKYHIARPALLCILWILLRIENIC